MVSLFLVVMGIRLIGGGPTRYISTHRFRVWTSTNTALTITVISIAILTSKKTGNKVGVVTDFAKSKVTMVTRSRVAIRASVTQGLKDLR